MRKLLILLFIVICASACQTSSRTIVGDLYFKLVDFDRFFDAPDSSLCKIENFVKSVKVDTLNKNDKNAFRLLQFFVTNNLLRKPFVRLKLDNGEIAMVFLDTLTYRQLSLFERGELIRNNKKVRIKFYASKIHYDSHSAFNMTKILSIKQVDGVTPWSK